MGKTDFRIGVIFLVLSLLIIVVAIPQISDEWRRSTIAGDQFFTLGPRFFPFVAATLMGIFAAWLIFFSRTRCRLEPPSPVARRDSIRSVVAFTTLGVGYVAVLPYLGALLATPLFLAGSFFYFGVRKWSWLVVFPLAITSAVVVAFEYLMMVQLP